MEDRMLICIQCGNEFSVSGQELEKLKTRRFAFPKRCSECRRKKSKNQNEENSKGRQKGEKRNKRGKESYWEGED
ncbi:zinc-ribbon domain containing protein [Thermodesulfobacteriota bacterium]